MIKSRNRGQFKPGTSGNPSGRPVGSRNRAMLLAEQLLEGEAEELIRQAIHQAKKGNIHALRLCLERLLPVRKQRSVELELPPLHNLQDIAAGLQCILAAAAESRITPAEAQSFAEVLTTHARILESVGLEQRIQALETSRAEMVADRRELHEFMQRFADELKKKD